MYEIIDWLLSIVFVGILCIIFAPLLVIYVLLVLSIYIPKVEDTFVFDIIMWVDRFTKRFKPPYTLKKVMYFILTYFISVALWIIILLVIF